MPTIRMILAATLLVFASGAGCVQQMANQSRLEPLEKSEFLNDRQASRELVPGTIPRGESLEQIETLSDHLLTGRKAGEATNELPPEVTTRWNAAQLLAHGQQQYRIYCVHCHDLTGSGQGMVPQRGFPEPPTYHSIRLRAAPLSHFVEVIEAGYGQMPAHGALVKPADRWSIAAYIRALQLSQHAARSQLNEEDLEQLNSTANPASTQQPSHEPQEAS